MLDLILQTSQQAKKNTYYMFSLGALIYKYTVFAIYLWAGYKMYPSSAFSCQNYASLCVSTQEQSTPIVYFLISFSSIIDQQRSKQNMEITEYGDENVMACM